MMDFEILVLELLDALIAFHISSETTTDKIAKLHETRKLVRKYMEGKCQANISLKKD